MVAVGVHSVRVGEPQNPTEHEEREGEAQLAEEVDLDFIIKYSRGGDDSNCQEDSDEM